MHDSSPLLEAEIPLLPDPETDTQMSLLGRLTKTSIGKRNKDGSLKVEADEPHGYVLTGPLCELATGHYRLEVSCRAGAPKAPDLPVLGLEAVATSSGQLAWRDFTADELKSGHATIAFFVPPDSGVDPTKFNFKFYHFGNSDITITAVNLIRTTEQSVRRGELRTWRLLGRLRAKKTAKRHRDGAVAVTQRKHPECFLDGPPAFMLPQGRYQLQFLCSAGPAQRRGQPVLGVEVIVRDRHQLAWRDFTADELDRGAVTISFTVPPGLGDRHGGQAPFSFAFFHLGNSDIAVRAVELREIPEDAADAGAPPVWRLFGRLQKKWRAGRIVDGRPAPGAAPVRRILQGIQPHLKLPAGRYRVRLDARSAGASIAPAMRVDVAAQHFWRPPRWLSPLFETLRWRIRSTLAVVATHQFSASELNAGDGAIDFEVPFEWSIESGADVWFDLRLARLSGATIDVKDVRIMAAPYQDNGANQAPVPAVKTTLRDSKQALVIIGNCQAEIVGHQLRATALSDRFSVNFHYFNMPDHEIEMGKRVIDAADLVLVQDIRDWEQYPLKDFIPASARIVKFPCLRLASLWPFDSYNGPGDPDALKRDWPQLKFPYLDGALARLRKETPDPERRLARYAALDMDLLVDPKRLHAFEERRLLAMDRQYQCQIGQFVLENFQSRRVFHTTTHPHVKLLAMLLEQLFKSLEIKNVVPGGSEFDRLFSSTQIPVHPMIGKLLGIKWATESARYLFDGEQLTWEAYVRRYIGYYG